MNLYHISQEANTDYDTYSDAVVAAESEEEARNTHPSGSWNCSSYSWVDRDMVSVVFLGVAKEGTEKGVICASYHAG